MVGAFLHQKERRRKENQEKELKEGSLGTLHAYHRSILAGHETTELECVEQGLLLTSALKHEETRVLASEVSGVTFHWPWGGPGTAIAPSYVGLFGVESLIPDILF